MGVGDASTRRIRFYGGHLLPSLFGDAVMRMGAELVFYYAKAKEPRIAHDVRVLTAQLARLSESR
jgi:hypothetical protein